MKDAEEFAGRLAADPGVFKYIVKVQFTETGLQASERLFRERFAH